MPLSPPASRDLIHSRQVECRGYRRSDGLWDVEGHLTDTKTYGFENEFRGVVPPGVPVHEMWVRLTVDDEMVIQDIETSTDHSPFSLCVSAGGNFGRLKGLKVGAGFLSQVRKLLGGTEGCTHLVEMMGPLATTVFQSIFPYRERQRKAAGERAEKTGERPQLLDTCHAFASDGEVTKQLWPDFYTGG
jgi:hypothetical protein